MLEAKIALRLLTQFEVFQGFINLGLKTCEISYTLNYHKTAEAANEVIKTIIGIDNYEAYEQIDEIDYLVKQCDY